MLSLAKLRVLVELERHGTLRAAAELLSYSTSAASWQLSELERDVGISLVARSGRRLVLTEAGHWLAGEAGRILGELDAIENQLAHYRGRPAGAVRLAVFPTAGHDLVVPTLTQLHETQPGIDVSVFEREPCDALTDLRGSAADLAVVCEYTLAPLAIDADLHTREVHTEEVFLALSTTDPAATTGRDVPIRDLRRQVWLAGERGGDDADLAERLCALGSYRPSVKHAVRDYRMMLAMVAAGLGVGFIPAMALDQAEEAVVFRRCRESRLWRRILVVSRVPVEASPVLAAVAETLQEAAQDLTSSDSSTLLDG
jgi:DNA-binding transcriptional LysR family regulator